MARILVLVIGLVWASLLLLSWGGGSSAPPAVPSALAGGPGTY